MVYQNHFFNRNINEQAYRDLLNNQLLPLMTKIFEVSKQLTYGLMIGTRRCSVSSINSCQWAVEKTFWYLANGLYGKKEWPRCSLNLTSCDFFFLWSYLKGKVFTNPPKNLQTLQQTFVAEFDLEQGSHQGNGYANVKTYRNFNLKRVTVLNFSDSSYLNRIYFIVVWSFDHLF